MRRVRRWAARRSRRRDEGGRETLISPAGSAGRGCHRTGSRTDSVPSYRRAHRRFHRVAPARCRAVGDVGGRVYVIDERARPSSHRSPRAFRCETTRAGARTDRAFSHRRAHRHRCATPARGGAFVNERCIVGGDGAGGGRTFLTRPNPGSWTEGLFSTGIASRLGSALSPSGA
jgi:hypothetical protein